MNYLDALRVVKEIADDSLIGIDPSHLRFLAEQLGLDGPDEVYEASSLVEKEIQKLTVVEKSLEKFH
jgi:hypothetical protein